MHRVSRLQCRNNVLLFNGISAARWDEALCQQNGLKMYAEPMGIRIVQDRVSPIGNKKVHEEGVIPYGSIESFMYMAPEAEEAEKKARK